VSTQIGPGTVRSVGSLGSPAPELGGSCAWATLTWVMKLGRRADSESEPLRKYRGGTSRAITPPRCPRRADVSCGIGLESGQPAVLRIVAGPANKADHLLLPRPNAPARRWHWRLGKAISPHSLRRSFITAALDAGVPLRDVQIAARHSDPRTTTRYDRARHNLDRHASYIVGAS